MFSCLPGAGQVCKGEVLFCFSFLEQVDYSLPIHPALDSWFHCCCEGIEKMSKREALLRGPRASCSVKTCFTFHPVSKFEGRWVPVTALGFPSLGGWFQAQGDISVALVFLGFVLFAEWTFACSTIKTSGRGNESMWQYIFLMHSIFSPKFDLSYSCNLLIWAVVAPGFLLLGKRDNEIWHHFFNKRESERCIIECWLFIPVMLVLNILSKIHFINL